MGKGFGGSGGNGGPQAGTKNARSAGVDLPGVYTQPYTGTEPTFLGEDYVCTELPTHITRARTKEQQALVDQAYEGWPQEMGEPQGHHRPTQE